MNLELRKVIRWFRVTKLSLNAMTTKYMIFSSKGKRTNRGVNITINDQDILIVQISRFSGVNVDKHLLWPGRAAMFYWTNSGKIFIFVCFLLPMHKTPWHWVDVMSPLCFTLRCAAC